MTDYQRTIFLGVINGRSFYDVGETVGKSNDDTRRLFYLIIRRMLNSGTITINYDPYSVRELRRSKDIWIEKFNKLYPSCG